MPNLLLYTFYQIEFRRIFDETTLTNQGVPGQIREFSVLGAAGIKTTVPAGDKSPGTVTAEPAPPLKLNLAGHTGPGWMGIWG